MVDQADEVELRRLRWKCRRGMRELDQLLTRWLEREWRGSPASQREVFLRLLETEDDKLWVWLMGRERPADAELAALVEYIRQLPP
ncbi:succinate dehydrogenase assembly factor 2 [Novilysobacter defluvii]|uniref:FAD assembly factor SdhE n=1 Tax=Lysobacter defluvii IMMIB APB-9 = DSM 18482 TaxID=1385515 RepID=A0A0A0M8F3_9GAMM|nr:succinate dehydrogenase assembly factor 2 [Lysobacter defluvii]KGO99360.1 hypothetical protein N791_08875 [Lysobacter defluvii IMMIB APB-9 = DSM 18482]